MDPATGKKSFLGTFARILAVRFPVIHPQIVAHIELTDGRGEVKIKLRLIDAEENEEPIIEIDDRIELADPTVVADMDFVMKNVMFPRKGEYRFQVFGNDQFIVERRLVVSGIRKK
jgi:hypothetical protein